MTVRRRLLLGVLAILTVLIAAVGVAEILVLRHVLYQRSAQGLRNEVRLLGADPPLPVSSGDTGVTVSCRGLGTTVPLGPSAPRGQGKAHIGPAGPQPGPAGAAGVAQALAAKSIASAIAGPGGTLLACSAAGRSGHQTSFAVPASLPARLSAASGYVTIQSRGHHLLAISQPVGPDTAILVADLGDDDTAVRVVLAVTVLGGVAALVSAAALSIPLLRSGLAPLRKVARTADAIAAGDLDQRADLARSADEVGQLGAAFDRMVDRLQDALVERDTVVERLRTHDQTMRRFVADASHELRTPLTAIRGSAQVLRLGASSNPDDLAEALGHIQHQTERMSRLVDDLLLLSHQESGQPSPPLELTDLGALVADQVEQWRTVAGDHPIDIETEPAPVMADHEGLTRLCTNLIDNARKYSPPHSPITIRVAALGPRVELSVSDHGAGIPPADRERVFQRFYRGDHARARATGGAGLGLAIVAGITAHHNGNARIHDNPGGGARIVMELPALPTPDPLES